MSKNNRIIIFLILFVTGLVGLYLYKKYQVAPTIELLSQDVYDEQNAKMNLSLFKGKPIIISYYASWCGDCMKELKELNEVKTKELNDIVVICITDEPVEKLISFKTKHNYPFLFYRLNKSFSEINIYAIPVTYLIGAEGDVVYNKVGAVQWKDNSFLNYAKKMLN